MANWLKPFTKDTKDPDAILIARLYNSLEEGVKKEKVGEFYKKVTKNGNAAEKRIADILDKLNDNFTCVSNIRIDDELTTDPKAAEFDFIAEDAERVIYVNVKYSDLGASQEDQCNRHENILKRLVPGQKQLFIEKVVTTEEETITRLEQRIEEYNATSTNKDDIFCRILKRLDESVLHIWRVEMKFDITKNDFINESLYKKYEKFKREIFCKSCKINYLRMSNEDNKIAIKGTVTGKDEKGDIIIEDEDGNKWTLCVYENGKKIDNNNVDIGSPLQVTGFKDKGNKIRVDKKYINRKLC